MRLLKLTINGITTYQSAVLDLTAIPSGMIFAVVGPNGAGKTTLLDCMVTGVLERTIRGGPLKRWATSKESELEAIYSFDGKEIRHRILIDGPKAKEEAFLWVDGVPKSSGKLPDYDAAVGRIYPPMSVIATSAYTGESTRLRQQDGVMNMGMSARKALFSYMMGLVEYEQLATLAAKDASSLADQIATIRGHIERLEALEAEIAGLEADLHAKRGEIESRQGIVDDLGGVAQQLLQDLERKRSMLETLETAVKQARLRQSELEVERQRASSELKTVNLDIEQMDGVIAQANVTREVMAQAERDLEQQATLRQQSQSIDSNIRQLEQQRDRLVQEIASITQEGKQQRERVAQIEADQEKIPQLERQVVPLTEARAERDRLKRELQELLADIRSRRSQQQTDEKEALRAVTTARTTLEQARGQAKLLQGVPCGGKTIGDTDCSKCQFLTTATAARDSIQALDQQLTLTEERATATNQRGITIHSKQQQADGLGEDIARLDAVISGLESFDRQLTAARARVEHAGDAKETLERLYGQHKSRKTELDQIVQHELPAAQQERQKISDALGALAPALGMVSARRTALQTLQQAEARRPDKILRQHALYEQLERVAHQLDAVIVPPEPTEAREARDEADRAWRTASQEHTQARQQMDALRVQEGEISGRLREKRGKTDQLPNLRVQVDDLGQLQAASARLAKDLGRNGLQAVKMDAAGPEISTILNDLLRELYGERFTCRLTTQVPYTDKARASKGEMKEVFDFEIFDGKDGKLKLPADLSKGELVCFDSTLRLALCVFNRTRSSAPLDTLYFDESTDGLDETVRPMFMGMLRRAMEIGGFHQAWVVSHNREVWEAADYLCRVGNGTAVLERL